MCVCPFPKSYFWWFNPMANVHYKTPTLLHEPQILRSLSCFQPIFFPLYTNILVFLCSIICPRNQLTISLSPTLCLSSFLPFVLLAFWLSCKDVYNMVKLMKQKVSHQENQNRKMWCEWEVRVVNNLSHESDSPETPCFFLLLMLEAFFSGSISEKPSQGSRVKRHCNHLVNSLLVP